MAWCLPLLLGILWFGVRIQAQLVDIDSCPGIKGRCVHEHELQRKWYQYQGIPTIYNNHTRCITLDLENFPKTFEYCSVKKEDSQPSCLQGDVSVLDPHDSGQFQLIFDASSGRVKAKNTVVYLSHHLLVLYGCLELPCLPGFRAVFMAIYSCAPEKFPLRELLGAYEIIRLLEVDPQKNLKTFRYNPCPACTDHADYDYHDDHGVSPSDHYHY